MNSKQVSETYDVEGFLETLGVAVIDISPSDKPDVIATLQNDGESVRVGIEVRRHFNDEAPEEGSPGKRLNSFWADVREEIDRLRDESGSLLKIHAYVTLRKEKLAAASLGSLREKFAREIFDFVTTASETATSAVIVIPDWEEREFREFHGYPLLEEYVTQIIVRKGFFAHWDANVNASHVGISPGRLAEIIREKNEKAANYKLDGLDELWLLLAASHETVFDSMHDFPDQINFEAPELISACENSPFNRIYFWSSKPHEWVRQIGYQPQID